MWTYFYHGILLYNEFSFNLIEKIRKGFADDNKKYLNSEAFYKDYPEIIAYFSYLPIKITVDGRLFEVNYDFMWEAFNGKCCMPFHTYRCSDCENGVVKKTTFSSALESFALFKTTSETFYINESDFVEQINRIYNVGIKL